MVQNYIVALIGLVTAGYIIAKVLRAILPHKSHTPANCAGCTSCPASGKVRYRELCVPGHEQQMRRRK